MARRGKMAVDRLERACAACDELVPVSPNEFKYHRAFTCQARTANLAYGLPPNCHLRDPNVPPDTRAAISEIIATSNRADTPDKRLTAARRVEILRRYIDDIGAGEPSLEWYRAILREYTTRIVNMALANLPYWHREPLRFESLAGIRKTDVCLEGLRAETNQFFGDLLSAYVGDQYDLLHFGFEKGLYGDSAALKVDTLRRDVITLAGYLTWLHREGHESLQHAGRTTMDRYMAETAAPTHKAYLINRFHLWAKKKHPFTPTIGYHRRRQGPIPRGFKVLNLEDSRTAFLRICDYPDPRGRALALLALLYAQQVAVSLTLKRSELIRDETTGLWTIARKDSEPFAIEKEVSDALDECLALNPARGDADPRLPVFANRSGRPYGLRTATRWVRAASGVAADKLRRTAIVNMYRSGQKTMGTVVLRDVLNVSPMTIRRAIRMTGESVNAPTINEDAEALRRAFLESDDD